jgi:hypothetical protein
MNYVNEQCDIKQNLKYVFEKIFLPQYTEFITTSVLFSSIKDTELLC